jgi:hypothetical protein
MKFVVLNRKPVIKPLTIVTFIPTEKLVTQQMQHAVKAANSTGFTLLKELNHQSISLFG